VPLVLHATKKIFGELQTKWRHPLSHLAHYKEDILVSCKQNGPTFLA
jgi:hypothetical protein